VVSAAALAEQARITCPWEIEDGRCLLLEYLQDEEQHMLCIDCFGGSPVIEVVGVVCINVLFIGFFGFHLPS